MSKIPQEELSQFEQKYSLHLEFDGDTTKVYLPPCQSIGLAILDFLRQWGITTDIWWISHNDGPFAVIRKEGNL